MEKFDGITVRDFFFLDETDPITDIDSLRETRSLSACWWGNTVTETSWISGDKQRIWLDSSEVNYSFIRILSQSLIWTVYGRHLVWAHAGGLRPGGSHMERCNSPIFARSPPSPQLTCAPTLNHELCQTYSVPGGSSRQLGLLQQHHILHAALGQVIGHADPHTPATDDDGVCGVLPPLPQDWGRISGAKERKELQHISNELESRVHLSFVIITCHSEHEATPAARI